MMGTDPRFLEVQRYRQWWLLVLLAGIFLPSAWAVIQQVILGVPWGNNPASDGWVLLIAGVSGLGLPLFILSLNLRTEVRPDGVYVRFWPLHLGWVHIPSDQIAECTAQTYRPLRDYGGWGIRWGPKGKAYNVSGNRGVLLVYGKGRRLLIGSQRPEELQQAIATIRGPALP